MESEEEALRLELKTKSAVVEYQARWAGIRPGMRVADIGCGPGKTTAILHKLVQPGGSVVGIDNSEIRIDYAVKNYSAEGIDYQLRNIFAPLEDLGKFDFIWVRFFLEYFNNSSFKIVQMLSETANVGGVVCLIDLDCNCVNTYGLPERLEHTILDAIKLLKEKANFDPYVGRKLYSYLFDLGFSNIEAKASEYHLIYGDANYIDTFNWMKKVEMVSKKMDLRSEGYKDGPEFLEEFKAAFSNPRRFIYTPVIYCRGEKSK